MAIYSNENITKITKLSHREFPHLVQNRENIRTRIQYHKAIHLPLDFLNRFLPITMHEHELYGVCMFIWIWSDFGSIYM